MDKLYNLTPLGRAELLIEEYLEKEGIEEQTEELIDYERVLSRYQNLNILQIIVKVLLYAGVITSVATSIGLQQVQIINQIASYIGVSFLALAYIITNQFTKLYREEYQIKREILISNIESN